MDTTRRVRILRAVSSSFLVGLSKRAGPEPPAAPPPGAAPPPAATGLAE